MARKYPNTPRLLRPIFPQSKNLKLAIEYGKELLASLEMLSIDENTFGEAWRIFSDQDNAGLSFTDSTSIALMRRKGIATIGTFDEDFIHVKGISPLR